MTHDEVPSPTDLDGAERLDTAWDALIAAESAPTVGAAVSPDLDPARAATIRRLHAFAHAPASDLTRERVWRRLRGVLDPDADHARLPRVPMENHAMTPTTVWPSTAPALARPVLSRLIRPRRWRVALEAVAAAIVIVALAGGYAIIGKGPSMGDLPVVGALFEERQDNPWRSGGGEFRGGGSLIELPSAPVTVRLVRATFEPGARWDIAAGTELLVNSRLGGLTTGDSSVPGSLLRGNTMAFVAGPSSLHNDGSQPVSAFIVTIAPDGTTAAPPAGVTVEELAGGIVDRLPGDTAHVSWGDATLVMGGADLQAQPELTDTGRDGVSLLWVESGNPELVLLSGSLRVQLANGSDGRATDGVGHESVPLSTGDSVLITSGAAFRIGNPGEGTTFRESNPGSSDARVQILSIINPARISDSSLADVFVGTPPADAVPADLGTPIPPTVFAEEIDPAECTTAPRTVENVAMLAATPLAGPFEGDADYTPRLFIYNEAELPQGPPADAATVAAITEVERQFAACYNAGDVGATLALLADEGAHKFVLDLIDGRNGTPRSGTELLAPPTGPIPVEDRIALFPVRGVRELPDGRIGAIVEWGSTDEYPGSASEANFRIYVQVAGRWVIEEEISGLTPNPQGTRGE